MANNYVQMSEQYDLTPEQVKWFQDFLALCEAHDSLDAETPDDAAKLVRLGEIFLDCDNDVEDSVVEAFDYFDLNVKESTVWVCDQDGEFINTATVCAVLQAMLKDTNSPEVLTGTCAETCDRPHVGEFGGGWFAVSAKEIRMGNSWDAAEKAAGEMKSK